MIEFQERHPSWNIWQQLGVSIYDALWASPNEFSRRIWRQWKDNCGRQMWDFSEQWSVCRWQVDSKIQPHGDHPAAHAKQKFTNPVLSEGPEWHGTHRQRRDTSNNGAQLLDIIAFSHQDLKHGAVLSLRTQRFKSRTLSFVLLSPHTNAKTEVEW